MRAALRACGPYFSTALMFSIAINILHLGPPLFMMQVYDRVLTSGNHTTLLLLTLILLVTMATSATLDAARARVLSRAGLKLDRLLLPAVTRSAILAARGGTSAAGPVEEYEGLKGTITGQGACAIFDLPWFPIHALVLALMHPVLGVFAVVSAALLLIAALLSERLLRTSNIASGDATRSASGFVDSALRSAGGVTGLGMIDDVLTHCGNLRESAWGERQKVVETGAALSAATRTVRQALQSIALALGAYLVIEQAATAGIMFAGSLLLGKALQPIEQIAATWRSLLGAPASCRALGRIIEQDSKVGLPVGRTEGHIGCQGLAYLPGGQQKPVLYNVSLAFQPGRITLLVGATGSGKSTLLKLLAGALPPSAGTVRLDGADVGTGARLAGSVGYLPQDIELLPGTVASNIARFGTPNAELVTEAGRRAGAHDAILRLPKGYETTVAFNGSPASVGLRQRIGLARALYGRPRILLLDEPTTGLDAIGETAFTRLLGELRAEGMTIVVASHRPALTSLTDHLVLLQAGSVIAAGPRNEVLSRAGSGGGRGKVVSWPG